MHAITEIYNSVPTDFWTLLAGGAGVSLIATALKHVLGLNSRKVVTTVVATLSFVAPALQFILSSQGSNIFTVVPHSAELFAVATLAYNLLIKDAYTFFLQVQAYQAKEAAKVDGVTVQTSAGISGPTTTVYTPALTSEFDG